MTPANPGHLRLHRGRNVAVLAALTMVLAAPAFAPDRQALARQDALDELASRAIRVALDSATGSPRLVRISPASLQLEGIDPKSKAVSFFELFGEAFGLQDPARELELAEISEDRLGMTHLSFGQVYEGIPVFGAELKAHFDRNGELVAVNGAAVPNIAVDPSPILGTTEAVAIARAVVAKNRGLPADELEISNPALRIYRSGLLRGVPGANRLAWEVEVSRSPSVRDSVFVDAHDGQLLDRIPGIHDLRREIYHHEKSPSNLIWSEGDVLPYAGLDVERDADINEIIIATGEIYDLFANLSGGTHLSPDGRDSTMSSVYEPEGFDCPNAYGYSDWTGYCFGVASDETVGHEWTHAYSDFTHGLIGLWQPGALNESYADIFGELLDIRNQRGLDEPSGLRDASGCSVFGGALAPSLTIHSPTAVAGDLDEVPAAFNPPRPWSVTAILELVDDGTGLTSDACESLTDFTPGRIALIDRGDCSFREMVLNASDAGAVGAIIANNDQENPDARIVMHDEGPSLDIPAFMISYNNGVALKSVLDQGVEATLLAQASEDNSLRWLLSEDDPALGAIRDMWHPECFSGPGRTGSTYHCFGFFDRGGVHYNCGVPNHAFALLVDGGSFNGQTVSSIGATKAAHIYWRAMSVWQTPTTKFTDHADALELGCEELMGQSLTDLDTGLISPEVINASDCDQVAAAMLAVEMRDDPLICAEAWVLSPDPPPVQLAQELYSVVFDSDPGSSWLRSNEGVFAEYNTNRNWRWTDTLPAGLDGGAMWAVNSSYIGNCEPGDDDQSGVLYLESPVITLPSYASEAVLIFDHFVATEEGWDGGNLKISVNGGPWNRIPRSAFIFNPYNWIVIRGGSRDESERENTNPLAGERAFTGGWSEDEPYAGWGQSQIDIGLFARRGDSFRVRFDFGNDGCIGAKGWYVANFKVLINDEPIHAVRRPSRRAGP